MFLEALYYFLPVYIANMAPPLFQWFPFMDKPVDGGMKFGGKRLFGSHKTIRGFMVACLFGTLTFIIQRYLYDYPLFQSISIIDYPTYPLMLGFLLGFGAIFGDLLESFFKRRINISSGKPWIPFDQLDYIFGAFIFSFFIFIPDFKTILVIVLLSPFLHLIVHYSGYLFGVNKDKI